MRQLRRVYAMTGVPFPGAEVTLPVSCTFHDATERRRVDKVRRDFVANASHELRTPFTWIRGFVEALEDGAVAEPETAERFLGKIRIHADRMAALVEDLLELSRVGSGERPPRCEEVLAPRDRGGRGGLLLGLARARIQLVRRRRRAHVVTDADRCAASSRTWWTTRSSTRPTEAASRSERAGAEGGAVGGADDGPGIGGAPAADVRALLPGGQGA